jgi:curved DNA-binding protein CbpA
MTDSRRTYYEILGVDTHATKEEISRAARRLSEKYHPDRVAHLDIILAKEYEKKMKQINEAKQVLCDPVARAKYNRRIRVYQSTYIPPVFRAKKAEVLTMEIIEDEDVDLECPVCRERFTVTKKACQDYVQCPACGKKGSLGDAAGEQVIEEEEDEDEHLLECPGCKRTMRIPDNVVPNETLIECPYCGARGTIG